MRAELGWSQSQLVTAASITAITSALAGPLLGRVVDLRGPRLVLISSVVGMGVGMAASGLVDQPWQLYVTFGLVSGVARSALQSVLPGTMIATWFVRRRSTAYGIAAMGPPCANLLMPPLLAAIVFTLGWRAGWIGLGLSAILLGLLPALVINRRRPEDLGQRPDGDAPTSGAVGPAHRPNVESAGALEGWTARVAIHSPAFWAVAAGMALVLLGPNVSIIFMFSYLSNNGIAPANAAAAVSAVSAMQVLSRLVFWAPVSGKINVRWLLVLWGGLMFCATLLLSFARGEVWSYLAAGLLGFSLGGNLILQLQVWPEYFGRVAAGTIIGLGSLLQGVTGAVVPLLLAMFLDHTGSYSTLYLIVSGCVLCGLALHLIVGRPRRAVQTAR
jgi:MFS family permease